MERIKFGMRGTTVLSYSLSAIPQTPIVYISVTVNSRWYNTGTAALPYRDFKGTQRLVQSYLNPEAPGYLCHPGKRRSLKKEEVNAILLLLRVIIFRISTGAYL